MAAQHLFAIFLFCSVTLGASFDSLGSPEYTPSSRLSAIHHKLYTEPEITFAIEEILQDFPNWTPTAHQSHADLIWVRNDKAVNWDSFNGKSQWVNRVVNESVLTSKGSLAASLHSYSKSHTTVARIPRTFLIYNRRECEELRSVLDYAPKSSLWIIKKTHLSRGIGASIHTRDQLLHRKELANCSEVEPQFDSDGVAIGKIVQEYIAKPLLLEGYKSEVRFYWIIISVDPWIVVMYPNATVRRTSQKYSLDDLSNLKIHLANVYQQKQGGLADLDNLKWTLPMLEDYLLDQHLISERGWLDTHLRPLARRYLYDVFMSAKESLQRREGTFALLGVDLLLDESLNMYLLEIQENPGMSRGGVKKAIIPPLVLKTISLLLEVQERRDRNLSLRSSELESMKEFLVIWNEADGE